MLTNGAYMKLTQKQETFCVEYFKTGNATESALAAGYSPKTAQVIASENLTKPMIVERISQLREKTASSAVADVLERKEILTGILRAKLTDFIGTDGEPILNSEMPNNAAANEYSVKTTYTKKGDPVITKEIKLHSPIQAIAELNKMEHIYETGVTLNFNDVKFTVGKGYIETTEGRNLLRAGESATTELPGQ